MRLLDTHTLKLKSFNDGEAPWYAILSHTWEEDEVTFEDLKGDATLKKGWRKLKESASLAKSQGFRYIWVDTCCIDKSSSAELSEAINSMFRWYKESIVCYVYLCDVVVPSDPRWELYPALEQQFKKSRWFTRGWTLQELIAPAAIEIYDRDWTPLEAMDLRAAGSQLIHLVAKRTGVPEDVLHGQSLELLPVAQKMSWAAHRKTTRPEDLAYCLLGLFRIHMPPLYGEGSENAFRRLQEEILKGADDESLFAWKLTDEVAVIPPFSGLLAPSPSCFAESGDVVSNSGSWASTGTPTSMTNRGLQIEARLVGVPGDQSKILYWMFLDCGKNNGSDGCVILVQRVLDYTARFIRARPDILATIVDNDWMVFNDNASYRPAGPDPESWLGHFLHFFDPELVIVAYIIQTPPPTILKFPILSGLKSGNIGECQVKVEAVSRSPRDLGTSLFSTPLEGQEGWVEKGPVPLILGMVKLTIIHGHYGVQGDKSFKRSRDPVLLLLGRRHPTANPCRTPALSYQVWYRFMLWPKRNDPTAGFPSVAQVLTWLDPTSEVEDAPFLGLYVRMHVPYENRGPGDILHLEFDLKQHVSTWVIHVRLAREMTGT